MDLNQQDKAKQVVDKSLKLTDKERRFMYSPVRLVIVIAMSIFATETIIMLFFEKIGKLSFIAEALLDSTLLTIFISPVLYFYLLKPLIHLVYDCRLNEEELIFHKEKLEKKVLARTKELEVANSNLQRENDEHVKSKIALKESEERFRRIFEQNEDSILLVSAKDFSVIDINPAGERTFGQPKEEILKSGLNSLCNFEKCNLLMSAVDLIIKSGEPGAIEQIECHVPGNHVRFLSFYGKKIVLQGSDVVYITFRDITTKVRLEVEAKEIQSRLIQANRMTSLGTMISSVAHELNNPNNFLLMNARILLEARDDIIAMLEERYQEKGDFMIANLDWQEARVHLPEAVEGIQQGAIRISDIIGNLKTISRDESANKEPQADVNKVVQLSVSILSYLISGFTDNFKLELGENLPLVRGFERQLEQVVINLIQNALQALPDKSHGVKVSTLMSPDKQHVLIQVHDEGRGLPVEIADRIMEPFFTTRLEQGGTGLGLAISSAIVKEFDGSITFVSFGSGRGSTFTVSLCQA